MTLKKIAILGLGAMGYRMVQNLIKTNYSVTIYNRTVDKATPLVQLGATYAATPRQATEQADIVISMVRDDQASRNIWLTPETGALWGLSKGQVAIESSTLSVRWTQELATVISSSGAAFLDAPVVGSRPQAEAGKLIYLVGGKAEILAQAQSVLLAAGGSTIQHIGAVGQGMAMKLAVNALFGIQVTALAEMLGMLDKQGITPAKAMECLSELPIISPAAKGAGSLMVMNRHEPMFPIELVEKDLRYVIDTAQAANAAVSVTTAIHDVYQDAIAKGYGNANITGVVQIFI